MNIRQYKHILKDLDTGISKELSVSPADWQELTRSIYRHITYNTVLVEDGDSQRFTRNGGRINDNSGFYFITDAVKLRGSKTRIEYTRQRLNPFTNDYADDYVSMLDCRVDAGYKEYNEWVQVKTIASSKLAKFIARDETDQNVFKNVSIDNITVPAFSKIWKAYFKSVDIYLISKSHGTFSGNKSFTTGGTSAASWWYNGFHDENEIGEDAVINNPAIDATIFNNILEKDYNISAESITVTTNFIIGVSVSVPTITTSFSIDVLLTSYDSVGVQYAVQRKNIVADLSGTGNYSQLYKNTYSIDLTDIVVPTGGRLDFVFQIFGGITSGFGTVTMNAYMTSFNVDEFIFYKDNPGYEDNWINGLLLHEAFTRLIQLYTSETDTTKLLQSTVTGRADSEFETYPIYGLLAYEFVTQGKLLRQIGNTLNLNFKDLFISACRQLPIGLWYDKSNDIFVLEETDQFFKSEYYSFHLGMVKDLIKSPAKDVYYNNMLTGYPKTDNEDFNGANEPNTETEHNISEETKTKLDIRSRYRTATIDQELLRQMNKAEFSSVDDKRDSYVYITKVDSLMRTVQGDLTSMTGFKGVEQYYNLRKTPRQNLINQQKIIGTALHYSPTEKYKFGKSAKEVDLTYSCPYEGVIVNENDDIPQLNPTDRLIDPIIYDFSAPYSQLIKEEIEADPHKIFKLYDIDGTELYGFIWHDGIKANEYKRIATYSLIKVNENRLP